MVYSLNSPGYRLVYVVESMVESLTLYSLSE